MRRKIMLVLSVVVLTILNYSIYAKQQLLEHGEVLLLELAPADPRSLMQGDYMRLRYAIALEAEEQAAELSDKPGRIVINQDANNIAQFVRFYDAGELAAGESLLRFRKHGSFIIITPNSFFFQEGHAEHYQDAKYGVFKFAGRSDYLLVGLADSNGELIAPL